MASRRVWVHENQPWVQTRFTTRRINPQRQRRPLPATAPLKKTPPSNRCSQGFNKTCPTSPPEARAEIARLRAALQTLSDPETKP